MSLISEHPVVFTVIVSLVLAVLFFFAVLAGMPPERTETQRKFLKLNEAVMIILGGPIIWGMFVAGCVWDWYERKHKPFNNS